MRSVKLKPSNNIAIKGYSSEYNQFFLFPVFVKASNLKNESFFSIVSNDPKAIIWSESIYTKSVRELGI